MYNYCLEFILSVQNTPLEIIKNSITEFGEGLEITQISETDTDKMREIKICMRTEDPTMVFDTCAQFGRLKSVKINEERSK